MKRQTILAGAGIMMVATVLSRVLGFVREGAMGYFWGRTPHTDAFWAAFGVPDLLYYLLSGGALSAAVIPVFTAYLHRDEKEESWRAANTLVTVFALCAVIGVGIIMIFARELVYLVAPGFVARDPALAARCATYVRIIAPMVIFTVTSALSTGILQSHRHFTAPAMAWLVYNFGIIGGAFIGGLVVNQYAKDPAGLRWPAFGVVVGAILLVAVQVPSLLARGFRFRPRLELSHPGVRETLRLFVPYMIGLAATQVSLLWLPPFFGSYFPGGVTSLRYANRLVVLPYSLFAVAISTAAFPAMAERAAAGEIGELRKLVSGSLRAVLVFVVPSAVGLLVLAGPILRLLWKQGAFDETAVRTSAFCLVYFTGSLVGLSGLQITNRAFFALKDRRTPPLVAVGYNLLVVVVAIGLMRTSLQYAAPAAALSVGTLVGLVVMLEILRRRIGGIDGRTIALCLVRLAVASAALAGAALLAAQWSGRVLHVPMGFAFAPPATVPNLVTPKMAVAIQVALSMGVGLAAYVLVLLLLRAPEVSTTLETVRQRLGKRAAVAAAEAE